jgi:two-component system, OmpR family, KDP operon response regulator KdpE
MVGRALIVEDDSDFRFVLSILLTTEGWLVRDAASLDDARALLADDMPDLVILDVHLGANVAGELLAQLACRADAPVTVLVSGSDDLRPLARRYGVAYVRKPISIEPLMETVDRALAQRRRPSLGHMRPTWISIRPSVPPILS